ncbi:probable proline transporter 2 isoform X1 [Citrus sinensis]|nr:probable proline transporter 2 [Citrus x clementina]XP_052292315.1 probable proline transporter 2 isoform X1 [Citrus sinensis]
MEETNNIAALSIEAAGKRDECQNQDSGDASAHTVGQDLWQQMGLMLVISFNSGYILSYSNLILVPLGWRWGILCMFLIALYTAYTQWLLSAFHFINGQRFIRYRNLMGYHYGRQMYYVTWVLQYLTLVVANIGFILLAARSLKGISSEFSDSPLRLQICIVIAGVAFFTFACFIPTMSAMRWWLVVSFFVTFTYIFILLFVLVNNGKSNKHRNYELKGSKTDKVFNALGAISAAVVANAPCLLPEMQSTLRQPVVKNMRKALYVQFTVGLLFYYGIPIVGYWAYGSTASVYLPEQISCVKWVKVFINSSVFLQSMVCQQVFISPIHETLDTKFLKLEESMFSRENIKRRFFLRGFLFAFNIFVAAAFPFIGDFVNLIGSFALIPITFVFPSMVFIKVKANTARVKKKAWHWFNVLLFSLVTVATTVAAVRFVIKDIHHYSFFTDV